MEQLYVFGTGNAQAIHCYNTCFAIRNDNDYFMVDAGGGNGILKILDDMKVDLNAIHHIFVTHEHGPHPGHCLDDPHDRHRHEKRYL